MPQGRTKKQIFLLFFLALFILVARLFYPFMTIILWSALLYAFIEPLFARITAGIGPSRGPGGGRSLLVQAIAGALSVFGVLAFAVPFGTLFVALVRQVVDLLGSAVRVVEEHPDIFSFSHTSPVGGFIYRLSGESIDLSSIDVVHEVKSFIGASSRTVIGLSGTLLKQAVAVLVTLAFMVFTLYFLLVDGRQIMGILVSAIPIEGSYTTMFMKKMREAGRQLVLGFFLVALYQGSAMFVLALLFRLDSPLVLATLTAIASFVPMVGTSLVWGPMTLLLLIAGNVPRALLFLALAAFFVSFVDNFMKPLILGERLRIHPLLIFFAIVGGLALFGINGLILGPLILIIFFASVEVYEQIAQGKAGPSEGSGTAAPKP